LFVKLKQNVCNLKSIA